jgi:hypothetical protein
VCVCESYHLPSLELPPPYIVHSSRSASNIHALITTSNTMRSESCCTLRLRYVDLVVSIEVAVEVC